MTPIPYRFFSRDDLGSLGQIEEIFSRKGIFFLEHTETKRWVEEVTPIGIVTTTDPLKAMRFDTQGQAMTFNVKNSLKNYIVTEHEFVDPPKLEPKEDTQLKLWRELLNRIDALAEKPADLQFYLTKNWTIQRRGTP